MMIVTFYSYKGGVGRTQLATNLAAYFLYYLDKNVLLIDWDLEAPGIHKFFLEEYEDESTGQIKYRTTTVKPKGFIDLFNDYRIKISKGGEMKISELEQLNREEYITPLLTKGNKKVDLLAPAHYDETYSRKINYFDWYEFYDHLDGKHFIEYLKKCLKDPKGKNTDIDHYDYIFIDSRTGLSDYSGICNIQLPDLNIIMTSPTHQSFEGCQSVVKKILDAHYVKHENRKPYILPILSRVIEGDNTGLGVWTKRFRTDFCNVIKNMAGHILPEDKKYDIKSKEIIDKVVNSYIEGTCLPHKNELAYGENILFSEQGDEIEINQIQKQFENIARLIMSLDTKDTTDSNRNNVIYDCILLETAKRQTVDVNIEIRKLTLIPASGLFVKRERELKKLEKSIKENQFVVVSGVSGMGRTSLVGEYIKLNFNTHKYYIWLDASKGIKNAFVSNSVLIENMGLTEDISVISDEDIEKKFSMIIRKLKKITACGIIVLDNMTTADSKVKEIDLLGDWKIIMITLSESNIESDWGHVSLKKLLKEQARKLFYNYYKREKKDKFLISILESIDYHTLGIEMIAKTAQVGNIKLKELSEALTTQGLSQSDFSQGIEIPLENGTETIHSILSGFLQQLTITTREKRILQALGILPSIPFRLYWLNQIFGVEEKRRFGFNATLTSLVDKGLLVEGKNDTFNIHKFIQEVIKISFPPKEKDVKNTIEFFTNYNKWYSEGELTGLDVRACQRSLLKHFKASESTLITGLRSSSGQSKFYGREFISAKNTLDEVKDTIGEGVDSAVLVRATRLSNFALSLIRSNEPEKALVNLEEAVALLENGKITHPRAFEIKANYGLALLEVGEFDKAETLLLETVEKTRTEFGERDTFTATVIMTLGIVYQKKGNYKKAKQQFEIALDIDREIYSENHVRVAVGYAHLASVMQDMGEYKAAEENLRKALCIEKEIYEENDPSVMVTYNNLATVLQDLGKYQEAKEILVKVLDADKDNPEELSGTYSNLSTVLENLGEHEEAKKILEQAVKSDEKYYGPEHPNTLNTKSNLAECLWELEEYEAALEQLKEILPLTQKHFGKEHPVTLGRKSTMALVYQDLGQLDKALEMMQHTVSAGEEQLGKQHPQILIRKSNLALLHHDLKRSDQAETLMNEVVAQMESVLGETHPNTITAWGNLALILRGGGKLVPALELLQKYIPVMKKVLGGKHPMVTLAKDNLKTLEREIKDGGG